MGIACGGRRNSDGGGVVRESNDMVVVRCCGVVVDLCNLAKRTNLAGGIQGCPTDAF